MATTQNVYYPMPQLALLGDLGSVDVDALLLCFTNSTHVFDQNDDAFADLTNVQSGNGLTTNGEALANVVVSRASGVTELDSDDVVVSATGTITVRDAHLYNGTPTTPTADPLLVRVLLDNTPADVTVDSGEDLTVAPHATNGWLQGTAT